MNDITKKEKDQEEHKEINDLECGTSLAETEHASALKVNPRMNRMKNYSKNDNNLQSLRDKVCCDIVGDGDVLFCSPFENSKGEKINLPLIYCDHTASSRPLNSIEKYISNNCLPFYGNTHTNTSITGSQSTAFVAESRQIVAESVNARISGKANLDVVLFTGSGTTSCVQLLIDCLGLKAIVRNSMNNRPIVFIGPFEHHSNLLPWRESGCEIIMIPESTETGDVDLKILENHLSSLRLEKNQNRFLMGTFSAASNVTGRVSDVNAIAALLHKYNALAFFDYATGASYLDIDMNPSDNLSSKDAIFISPHKMLGGINTPGVLVMKKHLVNQNHPPERSGGGTVFFVSNSHHRFLSNRIERFEGGTPDIVGIIRTGMTFLVKRRIHDEYQNITSQTKQSPNHPIDFEYQTHQYVVETLKNTAPNLILLGTNQNKSNSKHLPIFSFLIKCGCRFLHYNFVCAILNDIFGIQSRGGCQCAGPYSQRLLGLSTIKDGQEIPNQYNEQVENALLYHKEKAELLRPGFTRISLPFKGLRDNEFHYVLKALAWVSANAWNFMPQYRCNHRTGEWRHHIRQGKPLGDSRKWISHYDMFSSNLPNQNISNQNLENILQEADNLLLLARKNKMNISQALHMNDANSILGSDDSDLRELRWYVYPKECAKWLNDGLLQPPQTEIKDALYGALIPKECVTFHDSIDKTLHIQNQIENVMKNKLVEDQKENKKTLFTFRDGEHHTGDAYFDEIEDGFNDGELSERCEIYSKDDDAWIRIEDFLQMKKEKILENTITPSVTNHIIKKTTLENTSENVKDESKATVTIENKKLNIKKDFKKQNRKKSTDINQVTKKHKSNEKKPVRDSSTWGRVENTSTQIELIPKTLKKDNNDLKSSKSSKNKKNKIKPPPKMMRYINQAIIQFNMIEEGDNLLLGLSGGKDSLSLLHCLIELKRKLPINFGLQVCTIDPMTASFDPSPLIPYVQSLGLPYYYIKDDIVARASNSGTNGKVVSSLCAFCARMKRGNLYTTARRNNCNKLVLAQHLDDCAESMMMSVMHNGFLRTMKAHYKVNAGDLSVIRPMVYCRESLMTEFAKSAGLPVINENCPACFEEPKERDRVKKLLSREETLYPNMYDNFRRALIPLLHEDSTSIMRCYTEETVAKSRKEPGKPKKFYDYKPTDVISAKNNSEQKIHEENESSSINDTNDNTDAAVKTLSDFSDEVLVAELAKRRASQFRLHGAMRRLSTDENDPNAYVCTLNGPMGSVPCYELME